MITIFTIPKPFVDPHIRTIQRNAINSWKRMHTDVEVIILGNDPGVAETCKELDVIHIPNVMITEYGTPRLDSAFALVRERAEHDILMYSNADMILTDDFIKVVEHAPKGEFLICGRRWDYDITTELDFKEANWADKIRNQTRTKGVLHSPAGMDYFMFRKESFKDMPALVVGRIGWDNWMIWYCRERKMPSIDITRAVTAIHQNHGYPGYNKGVERKTNPEAQQNVSFIKDRTGNLSVDGAALIMTKGYKLRKNYRLYIEKLKKLYRF